MIKNKITLDDILRLSHKENEIEWSDFNGFECTDVGSGIYIFEYKLEESEYSDFVLRVSGVNTDEYGVKPDFYNSIYYYLSSTDYKPYSVELECGFNSEKKFCDIRTSSEKQIMNFIKENTK